MLSGRTQHFRFELGCGPHGGCFEFSRALPLSRMRSRGRVLFSSIRCPIFRLCFLCFWACAPVHGGLHGLLVRRQGPVVASTAPMACLGAMVASTARRVAGTAPMECLGAMVGFGMKVAVTATTTTKQRAKRKGQRAKSEERGVKGKGQRTNLKAKGQRANFKSEEQI